MPARFLSHLGICVSDLERSIQFYCEALGFQEIHRLRVNGAAAATLLQLEADVELEAAYLTRDGVRIELLHYPVPGHVGAPEPRPMNGLGLTHLSFRVDDLPGTLDAIVAAGGRLVEGTRIYNQTFQAGAVFLTDPDGTRIELVESPGDPSALPGS